MLRKIKAIEKVFKQLDKETEKFENLSGLKCIPGCSICCTKKDLQANVLEFLPLAYHLVSKGLYEHVLKQIDMNPDQCVNLNSDQSGQQIIGCSVYAYRGLICRLFGSSAVKGKDSRLSVYACKPVKEAYRMQYLNAMEKINKGMKIPIVSDFYYRIYFIDPNLAKDYNPINQSIRKAIEIVAYYYLNIPRRPRINRKTA